MKRIIFPLLVAFASLLGVGAHAQSSVRLAADAPDSYTVERGDTLWGNSGLDNCYGGDGNDTLKWSCWN